jgi:ABC-type amino acid transport system permease subunit
MDEIALLTCWSDILVAVIYFVFCFAMSRYSRSLKAHAARR